MITNVRFNIFALHLILAGQPSHTINSKGTETKAKEKEDSAKKGLEVLAAIQRTQEAEKLEKQKNASPSTLSNKISSPVPNQHEQQISPVIQNQIVSKTGKQTSPGKESLKSSQSVGATSLNSHLSSKNTNGSLDVDNFVPSAGDDASAGGIDNFLDFEVADNTNPSDTFKQNEDSSDDGIAVGSNPMVAKVMDDDSDIEIDDVIKITPPKSGDNSILTKDSYLSQIIVHHSSSSDDDLPNVCPKVDQLGFKTQHPNNLVKKVSDVSTSGASDKSSSSRRSKPKKKLSYGKEEHNSGNNSDFVFDLNSLSLSDRANNDISEDTKSGDEKHNKHRKKHKKDKKDSKKSGSSSKKSKKTKEERERDDLEEFLNGSITNEGAGVGDNGASNFAAPENYEEL